MNNKIKLMVLAACLAVTAASVTVYAEDQMDGLNPCEMGANPCNPCNPDEMNGAEGDVVNPCDAQSGSAENPCDPQAGSAENPCDPMATDPYMDEGVDGGATEPGTEVQ